MAQFLAQGPANDCRLLMGRFDYQPFAARYLHAKRVTRGAVLLIIDRSHQTPARAWQGQGQAPVLFFHCKQANRSLVVFLMTLLTPQLHQFAGRPADALPAQVDEMVELDRPLVAAVLLPDAKVGMIHGPAVNIDEGALLAVSALQVAVAGGAAAVR